MFEGNVIYWELIVLSFITKEIEGVRQAVLLAIWMAITTAISPTRFMNYVQNIVFMVIEKSLQF